MQVNPLRLLVFFLLSGLLMAPAPAFSQVRERPMGAVDPQEVWRGRVMGALQLSPEKAEEFKAVEARSSASRQELEGRIQKAKVELKGLLANPKPDEATIKELAGELSADQEKLLNLAISQMKEEMALLTPVQQAKYLLLFPLAVSGSRPPARRPMVIAPQKGKEPAPTQPAPASE